MASGAQAIARDTVARPALAGTQRIYQDPDPGASGAPRSGDGATVAARPLMTRQSVATCDGRVVTNKLVALALACGIYPPRIAL